MGMKVKFNPYELSARIETAGDKAVRNAIKGLQNVAEDIAETASAMAPRDTGALERSIRVTRAGQGRDALGRFTRAGVTVYIDPLATNPDTDEYVTDYAAIMHWELTPYGELQLGEKSEQKGGDVGGGFIERALEERIDDIEETVADQVSRALR